MLDFFLGAVLVAVWLFSIAFAAATMYVRNRSVGVGFLLGIFLGPVGWIVACLLPSMREEDLIRNEVQRLRVQRKARSIVDREGVAAVPDQSTAAPAQIPESPESAAAGGRSPRKTTRVEFIQPAAVALVIVAILVALAVDAC